MRQLRIEHADSDRRLKELEITNGKLLESNQHLQIENANHNRVLREKMKEKDDEIEKLKAEIDELQKKNVNPLLLDRLA